MEKVTVLRPYQKYFDIVSHVSAVGVAFAIPFSTALMNVCIVLAIVCMLLAGHLREKVRVILSNRAAIVFLLFFLLFWVGMLYTSAPFRDAFEMLRKFDKFLLGALLVPLFVEERWRRYAMNAFIGGVVVVMLAAILKKFGVVLYHTGTDSISVFKSYIATSFVLTMMAFFVAHRCIDERAYRWFYVCLILASLYGVIFVSRSRSGYILLFMLLLLFFWQRFSFKGLLVGGVGVFMIASSAYMLSFNFKLRIDEALQSVYRYYPGIVVPTSTGHRLAFAYGSLHLVKQHPFAGAGTGSFQSEYRKFYPSSSAMTSNPHNEYLNIAVQFGALGLGLMLVMFAVLWRSSFRLFPEMRYIAQGTLLAIAFGALGNSWLMDTTQGHFFVYFTVLVFAALPTTQDVRYHFIKT